MIRLVNSYKTANCITHSGTMHADEVFATAFLHLLKDDLKVYRTAEVDWDKVEEDTIVYDLGRREFDHHQIDAEVREDGIKYSSIGLLWKKFGKELIKKLGYKNIEKVHENVDKDLIEAIDGDDNGMFPKIDALYKVKTLSNIIKLFNPSFLSDEDEGKQFLKAVKIAEIILEEEISCINGKILADIEVRKVLKDISTDKQFIILEKYLPYEDTITSSDEYLNIKFVAYPSNRGGYAIKTVPKSSEDKTIRELFPKEWAGLIGEELEKVSGIKGIKFCHSGRFILTCDSLESTKKVLDKLCK